MSLQIETFTNQSFGANARPGNNAGGNTLFKALGHPLAAEAARRLMDRLQAGGPIAIYDPDGSAETFDAFYRLRDCDIAAIYVQRVEELERRILSRTVRLIGDLPSCPARLLLVTGFDAARRIEHIRRLLPAGTEVISLDLLRLPEAMLSNRTKYLDPLNFATNFAFLRDAGGMHTRVVTANYWGGYGAADPGLWLCLFDEAGNVLQQWTEAVPQANASLVLDSREIRRRFGLGEFTGSLFIHALRIKGHDVVKYALDTFSDDGKQLSCTHDANAWPADYYAGLPAPDAGERVVLWVQNSHPVPVPAGGLGLNLMGSQEIAWLQREIPPFASFPLDVAALLPAARWPQQIEVQAGRHFVRPRYEISDRTGRLRIAHANVERIDLKPDPAIPTLGRHLGKGYIMPLPVLPLADYHSLALPTPMTTAQRELPLKALLIDASGATVAEKYLGRIARRDSLALDIDDWLEEAAASLPSGTGHVELLYDFRDGGEADGWLHAIGRYRQRRSGHLAETSFGAHIYNTVVVYRDEPQSYVGAPPGLSTRLFLRLGEAPFDTICHLIYPASLPWTERSVTSLSLHDRTGEAIVSRQVAIPCGGSLFWRYHSMFDDTDRKRAGPGAYVLVRDSSCRLFGFHGVVNGDTSFCLDHMFGF